MSQNQPEAALPARWYRDVKFYLAIVEIVLILIAAAIHVQPHWFASTAYDHLAAGNPTFVLEQQVAGDDSNIGFCPIVDPYCAKWQSCSATNTKNAFVCKQSKVSTHFSDELLSGILAANNAVEESDVDDQTNKTAILDCLKISSTTEDKNGYVTARINLGHRLNDVRVEADALWRKIQERQTTAIRSIWKEVIVVVSTMVIACFMLFARYWWEKSLLSRCWGVTDFSTVDLKVDEDENDTAAWDHRLTLFFCVLGTAVVPVVLLAHHSTSNTKPIQFLTGLYQPVSSLDTETNISFDTSFSTALLCQLPPADAKHSRTCVQWNSCRKIANLQTSSNKNVVILDCSNGTVTDFSNFTAPPSRHFSEKKARQHSISTSRKTKEESAKCRRDGSLCSEQADESDPVITEEFARQSVCIQVLVEELHNLKHLSGSRLNHVKMQGQILFYLYTGLSLFFAAFLALILNSVKTIILLSICCRPVVMSYLQYLCHELCVYFNYSDNVFTKQSRAILVRKLKEDETDASETKKLK